MKTTKKLLALILVMITVFGCFSMCITASAAETLKTIQLKSGTNLDLLEYNSSATYKFNVPVSSNVYVTFYPKIRDTFAYGKFEVSIKDAANNVKVKKTIEFNGVKGEAAKRIYVDLKAGDYKMTVRYKCDGDCYGQFRFIIWEKITKNYPTTSLTLDKSSVTVKYDITENPKLTATQNPYYTNDKITWTTSNKYVATVNDGVIEPLRLGKATITAKSGKKTAKCTVNIKSMPLIITKDKGAQYLKKYVKYVENAEGGKWSCTDKNIGTISSTGKFTPKKNGSCFVNFKTTDGKYYKIYVVVADPVMITASGIYSTKNSEGLEYELINLTEKTVARVKVLINECDSDTDRVLNSSYRYFSSKTINPYGTATLRCKVSNIYYSRNYYYTYIKEVKFTDGTTYIYK